MPFGRVCRVTRRRRRHDFNYDLVLVSSRAKLRIISQKLSCREQIDNFLTGMIGGLVIGCFNRWLHTSPRYLSWLALEPFRLGNGFRHFTGAAIETEQAIMRGPCWIDIPALRLKVEKSLWRFSQPRRPKRHYSLLHARRKGESRGALSLASTPAFYAACHTSGARAPQRHLPQNDTRA
jgi:hypothetical protein